jgi:hypothetical protein
MSKMDGLRAMREARYAQDQARAARSNPAPRRAPQPPAASVPTPPAEPVEVEPVDANPESALCGHRNMGGRTCTRESGHAAKSHRYS